MLPQSPSWIRGGLLLRGGSGEEGKWGRGEGKKDRAVGEGREVEGEEKRGGKGEGEWDAGARRPAVCQERRIAKIRACSEVRTYKNSQGTLSGRRECLKQITLIRY